MTYPHRTLRSDTQGYVHGPLGVRIPFTVEHVQAPAWSWRIPLGPIHLHLHHDLHRIAGTAGRSRALLRMTGPTALLTAYAPIARWALTRLGRAGEPAAPTSASWGDGPRSDLS